MTPSIRTTAFPWSSGTQTSPLTTSRLTGLTPTLTVETSFRAVASIRETEPLAVFDTQTTLPLVAIHDEAAPPERTFVSR